jgi:hypothetical protein
MPYRVSPTDRIRGHIDELFASGPVQHEPRHVDRRRLAPLVYVQAGTRGDQFEDAWPSTT